MEQHPQRSNKEDAGKVLNTAPARSMKAATKAILRFTGRSKIYQRAVFATLHAISMRKTVKANWNRPLCARMLFAVVAALLKSISRLLTKPCANTPLIIKTRESSARMRPMRRGFDVMGVLSKKS